MLAENFKTADELNMEDKVYQAHITVLRMLERGEMTDARDRCSKWTFSMGQVMNTMFSLEHPTLKRFCVGCIGGYVMLVLNDTLDRPVDYDSGDLREFVTSHAQERLYFPPEQLIFNYTKLTMEQATIALRNFLTVGDPLWDEILAEKLTRKLDAPTDENAVQHRYAYQHAHRQNQYPRYLAERLRQTADVD